jgi:hypothetical protein
LPSLPVEAIAVLRLDGDLCESTIDALVHLEPNVSPGGFVLVDGYGGIEACARAVEDYRLKQGITAPITRSTGPQSGGARSREPTTRVCPRGGWVAEVEKRGGLATGDADEHR